MLKKVYIELTTKCNLSCPFCYRNTWENEDQDMDIALIDQLHKEITNDIGIVFGGIGEPTVAKHFSYAVNLFKDHHLEMTTNGIIKKSLLPLIVEHFDQLIISVDGVDEDYADMREVSFSYLKETLEFINTYKKKNNSKTPHLEFAFVLTKSNKDTIYKVIDTAFEYNVDQILISHLLPTFEHQLDDIYYSKYKEQEKHDYLNKVNQYAYYNHRTKVLFPYMEIKTERYCPFVEKDYTYVDHLGDVVPCYRLANSYTEYVFDRRKDVKKHAFGSIKDASLEQIYEKMEYQDFRTAVKNTKHPSCVDCDYVDGCSFVESTEYDCYSYTPSCADCLWNRNIIKCT